MEKWHRVVCLLTWQTLDVYFLFENKWDIVELTGTGSCNHGYPVTLF